MKHDSISFTPTSGADHHAAQVQLLNAGWSRVSRGDWAFVYQSPCLEFVARVTAFDPAYELHSSNCVAHPDCRYFQRVYRRMCLPPAGEFVMMERLEEANFEKASELCCRLGEFEHLGRSVGRLERQSWARLREANPELMKTYQILQDTITEGHRVLGYFAGLDVRPQNVMQTGEGQLKLIDPFYVSGEKILADLQHDISTVLRHYSRRQLSAFLEISCFQDERYISHQQVEVLKAAINRC